MRLAVFGVGGVGGYFGARLAEAGEDVWFVARGSHLAAMRASGLRLLSVKGDAVIQPVRVTDRAEEIGTVDTVIVGVKAWQLGDAARSMQPLVGPHTAVLPLQNGVSAPDEIDAVLGPGRALGGVAWISAKIAAPGVIEHMGIEPRVALGEMSGSRTERVAALAAVLSRAGVLVDLSEDIRKVLWSKFVFMAATSAVGSTARVSIGDVRETSQTRHLLIEAMEEAAAVGRAAGVALDADVVTATMAFVDSLPHEGTSSMQRDIMAGKPSELHNQSGTLVKIGRELGVPTPVHGALYAALCARERLARQRLETAE